MENNIQTSDLHIEINGRDAALGTGVGLVSGTAIVGSGIYLAGMVSDSFNNEVGAILAALVIVTSAVLGITAGGLSMHSIPQWSALGAGRARIKTEEEKRDSARLIPGRDLC